MRSRTVERNALPARDRDLLDHSDRMTPTLERFHATPLTLNVLGEKRTGETYVRKVVLTTIDTGVIVELAAIKIELGPFDAASRALIFEGRKPFGAVLATSGLEHQCAPSAFLEIEPDAALWRDLGRPHGTGVLYGRRNRITTGTGAPLADVVEVLPPP